MGGTDGELAQLEGGVAAEVLGIKDVPQHRAGDLVAGIIRPGLHHATELHLQATGQLQVVIRLHQVGHAALARLAVDADHGLIGAPHVLGINRQVGGLPTDLVDRGALRPGPGLQVFQALLDRILVRSGERRVDQVAGIGGTGRHRHPGAVLDGAPDGVHVGEVDHRIDALAEQVHAQGHQVDIAGALAVAEQATLDALGAGHLAQLGGCHGAAPVVVAVH